MDGEMGGGGWVEAEVQRPARSRLLLEIRDALHTTIRGEASRGLGNVEAARCRLGLRAQHSERRMRKVFCIKEMKVSSRPIHRGPAEIFHRNHGQIMPIQSTTSTYPLHKYRYLRA